MEWLKYLLASGWILVANLVYAIDTLHLQVGDLQSSTPPWQARQIDLNFKPLSDTTFDVDVRVGYFNLAALPQALKKIFW